MSFHRQRTSLGLCSDFQRGGCTFGCNWFKTTQKHFIFTFRFIIKKILPVVWIITLNLNCYIFPHKNAGAFNGFNRDGVIKRARANARTAGAGAPTNKPSTPVWLQIKHAARSQCSGSLECRLKFYLDEKNLWERAKSWEARPNSERTEEEKLKGEAFPPVFRLCIQGPASYLFTYF